MAIDCQHIRDQEWPELYVAGGLSRESRDAYEAHFFECDACAGELDVLRAARSALQEMPRPQDLRHSRRTWLVWAGAAAIAAAVPVAVLVSRSPSEQIAQQPAPVSAPVADPFVELALFQPPAYRPLALRGGNNAAAKQFEAAMEIYQQGDYSRAKAGLEMAVAADSTRIEAHFFLAACDLLTNDAASAATEARRVIQAGDSPFREEAHYVLAKALLASRDAAGARRELEEVIRLRGDLEQKAQQLLDAVQRSARP